MREIHLRRLRDGDEQVCLAANDAMVGDDFEFLLGYDPSQPWPEYVRRTHAMANGADLPEGFVPAEFLVAELDGGPIVGRSSVRFAMTPWMAIAGGHIGYGVLPEHRRNGYATEILRQSLDVARSNGVNDVLVTCDEHNVGSASVIERCGGAFAEVVDNPRGGPRKRRYWFHRSAEGLPAPLDGPSASTWNTLDTYVVRRRESS